MKKVDGGYLLRFFEKTIGFLYSITIFELIKKIFNVQNFRTLADTYVCSMILLSVLLSTNFKMIENHYLTIIILCFVIYRIYEMTITIIHNFFASDQNAADISQNMRIYSIKRSILLFVLNIFEIVNLFIILYIGIAKINNVHDLPCYFDFFKASFFAFVIQDVGRINDIFSGFENLSFLQCALGYFYTVYLLAILIGNAPRIKSLNKN